MSNARSGRRVYEADAVDRYVAGLHERAADLAGELDSVAVVMSDAERRAGEILASARTRAQAILAEAGERGALLRRLEER
jgi:hypothetical protein